VKEYKFVEPTESDAVVTITEERILKFMKETYPDSSQHLTDEEMIESFVTERRAWEVENGETE
jgi:hypothetical protein